MNHPIYIKHKLVISLIVCGGFFSYWILKSLTYPPHDFSNSYFSAFFFVNGKLNTGIFDPYTFNTMIASEGYKNIFASFNPNPPSIPLLFSPLTIIPLEVAKLLFNIFSVIYFMIALYGFCKHLNLSPVYIFLILPFLLFIPLRNNVLFGQTYLLITALIMQGYIAYEKQKIWQSSLIWSLAVMLKVFPAIILLFLILKKEWKQTFIMFGICLSITLIGVMLQGFPIWHQYFTEILPRSSMGDLHSAYTASTQSMAMLLKYWFQYDPVFNLSPVLDSRLCLYLMLGLWSAILISISVSFVIQHTDNLLTMGFLLICSQLISPQGSSYSAILLIIILIALYRFADKKLFICVFILVFLIAAVPITIFQHSPLTILWFPRLILTIGIFLVIIIRFKIFPSSFILIGLIIFFAGAKFLQQLKVIDTSQRWVDTEYNSLIVDYTIHKNELLYSSWTDQGLNTLYSGKNIDEWSSLEVRIENNQVFFKGKMLTNSPDLKKKPTLINKNSIIYLSDKDKGIGFYAIRKLQVQ